MKYKVKVTVIDKKLYPELQEKYCADPDSGACPCYNVGDEFIFERDEAWDAIARYIYAGLQGGSIMKGWMKKDNEMIACCSDGTRPVIFKIERIDVEE